MLQLVIRRPKHCLPQPLGFRSFRHATLSAFEQSVGNTPLLYLKSASESAGCNIYGKAEFMNPGGSVKDRAALWMIRDGEDRGDLVRGEQGIIVEGTAGNTGIGLAMAGAVFGYRSIICLARTQSQEKKNALRYAGAELVEVDAVPFKNSKNYVHVAARLAENLRKAGHRVLYANQWDNLANKRAHIQSTGPEIWTQTRGRIDAFSCAMGTGGTIAGVGTFLRMMNPDVSICLTDPQGAAIVSYFNEGELKSVGSSISEGIGQGRVTGQIIDFRPSCAFEIPDSEMMETVHRLQSIDGLCLGLSSGINVGGAIRVAKELNFGPDQTVVTILCDSGERYATKQFNLPFLRSQNLQTPPWMSDDGPSKKIEGFDECLNRAMEG